jgi:hypothetical protein
MTPTSRARLGLMAASCLVFLATAAVLAPTSIASQGATPQARACDPYLPISLDNPFGYRPRGDRCEGVYIQPVSSTPLVVASFGQLNLPESFRADGALLLEWAPGAGEVRLRTTALKPRTYYRMDSRLPAASHSYRWPTDVLAALHLTSSDIGVVAWTSRKIGTTVREMYLPLRIGEPAADRENMYELLLIPGSELAEVFIGLASVGEDGAKRRVISEPKPLKYRFYPAGRAVRIPVGPLPSAGSYVLDIGATLRDGGAISHEIWFVHVPVSKPKSNGQ